MVPYSIRIYKVFNCHHQEYVATHNIPREECPTSVCSIRNIYIKSYDSNIKKCQWKNSNGIKYYILRTQGNGRMFLSASARNTYKDAIRGMN